MHNITEHSEFIAKYSEVYEWIKNKAEIDAEIKGFIGILANSPSDDFLNNLGELCEIPRDVDEDDESYRGRLRKRLGQGVIR